MKSRKYEKSSSSLQFDKIITWLGFDESSKKDRELNYRIMTNRLK